MIFHGANPFFNMKKSAIKNTTFFIGKYVDKKMRRNTLLREPVGPEYHLFF